MVSRKRGPIMPVAFIAQHTSTLMPRNGILWIGTGNSLLWNFIYQWVENKFHHLPERVWCLFLHNKHHEGDSSQNSVLLHDLYCRVYCLSHKMCRTHYDSTCLCNMNMLTEVMNNICQTLYMGINQGRTKPRCLVAVVTKFCTIVLWGLCTELAACYTSST